MTARLYPATGPAIPATFSYDGITGKGRVNGTFPDGETFEGEYFTITNTALGTNVMATRYGLITTVSLQQMGPQVSHTTAVGTRGTNLQCVSFPRGASGFGGCRDSKGNEYRLHY